MTFSFFTEDFNNLMMKVCSEFSASQDESKFELCGSIRTILSSFPKAAFEDEPWLPLLQKGLQVIHTKENPGFSLIHTTCQAK